LTPHLKWASSLGDVLGRCPFLLAFCAGVPCWSLILGLYIAVLLVHVQEPFRSVSQYLREVIQGGIALTLAAMGPLALAVLIVRVIRCLPKALLTLQLLSSVLILLPFGMWSFAAAMRFSAQPGFFFGQAKPEWVTSTPVQLFGHPLIPPFGIAILGLWWFYAWRVAETASSSGRCPSCGYILDFLPAGHACSECGWRRKETDSN
jgi:hypothetical protein